MGGGYSQLGEADGAWEKLRGEGLANGSPEASELYMITKLGLSEFNSTEADF